MTSTETLTARPLADIEAHKESALLQAQSLYNAFCGAGRNDDIASLNHETATLDMDPKTAIPAGGPIRNAIRALARDGWGMDALVYDMGTADFRRIAIEGARAVAEIEARVIARRRARRCGN